MGNKQMHGTLEEEATESIPTRFVHYTRKRLQKYWLDCLLTIIILAASAAVHWAWIPFDTIFIERDSDLSYPYVEDENAMLPIYVTIILSIVIPIILTFIFQVVIRFWKRPKDIHPKAIDPFLGSLVLGEAYGINALFSEFLKSYTGKKRPNFFAMCNYMGYRDAIKSGNFTYYLANTDPNRFGSMDKCLEPKNSFLYVQSMSSYPSGHASFAFCGFTIFCLLVIYIWHCHTRKQKFLKAFFLLLGEIIALVLSWSRSRDYWHSYDDIYAGAVIGAIIGTVIFLLNFSFGSVDRYKKKVEHKDQNAIEKSKEESSNTKQSA